MKLRVKSSFEDFACGFDDGPWSRFILIVVLFRFAFAKDGIGIELTFFRVAHDIEDHASLDGLSNLALGDENGDIGRDTPFLFARPAVDDGVVGDFVIGGGELEVGGAVVDREDVLDAAFSKGILADDECAFVDLECSGKDLAGRCGAFVDENDYGEIVECGVFGGFNGPRSAEERALCRGNDLALIDKSVGNVNCSVQAPTRVETQVDNEA